MALLNVSSVCPCGEKVEGKARKPTYFTNSVAKLKCESCSSRFMITCVRDREIKGRRSFTSFVDILFLSDEAKQVQSSKIQTKAKTLGAKALNAVGIKPKPDTSVVEVEMD